MLIHEREISLEKKEIMKESEIERIRHYYSLLKDKPYSIQQIARRKRKLIVPKEGMPDTGTRPDGSDFFDAAMELKVLNEETDPSFQTEHPEYNNELGGGDPMKSIPFPGVIDAVTELLNSNILSQYPTPEGDYEVRNKVLRYLKQENFSNKLTEDNIIFSVSTTHAFNLVCTLVLRPYDVVLFEAPTYGLFTFSPERVGGITRFFPLYESENWSFEPHRLEKLIDQINEELRVSYKDILNYEPRVSMIYQTNPQNPIGRVISKQDIKQLRDVLSVCHNKGVLYVDDLIYKDLSYGKDVFPAMGIRGAAVATVAGYLLSMILAFALLLGKKQKVRIKIKEFHMQKRMIARIFALGLPSFIMNALSSFMVTFVNLFLVAYSDTAIAFFGAYFKVQQLIVMTVNGLIQGCLPIMRFNYGAGNRDRLHSAFRYGTALVSGMMILGTLTVNFFPAQLLKLFTASEAMRSFGISAMRIMAASYLFCGLSTMISTYFQATEKVGSSIAIQLCRQLLFLVPALWCLNKLFQLNGIWLAFPVAETATMLIALIIMAWHRHKNIL